MNERKSIFLISAAESANETALNATADFLDEPKFEGFKQDTVSRVAAYIAVAYENNTFCQADIINALKINPGGMSKLTHILTDNGFIDDLGSVSDSFRANRPITVLQANEKLLNHVDHVPAWHEKAIFFRVMQRLELTEAETTKYLIRLGAASLSINYDEMRATDSPKKF